MCLGGGLTGFWDDCQGWGAVGSEPKTIDKATSDAGVMNTAAAEAAQTGRGGGRGRLSYLFGWHLLRPRATCNSLMRNPG